MPKKLYYNYYFFKGHWENKNLEKGEQNGLSNNYFLHQRYKKTARTTLMASRLWLAAYIVQLFNSQFSLVYFSGLKYILARQILHFRPQNARQSDNDVWYFQAINE